MVILQGKSVFGGVAIGKIQFFKRDEIQIKRRHVDDPEPLADCKVKSTF